MQHKYKILIKRQMSFTFPHSFYIKVVWGPSLFNASSMRQKIGSPQVIFPPSLNCVKTFILKVESRSPNHPAALIHSFPLHLPHVGEIKRKKKKNPNNMAADL